MVSDLRPAVSTPSRCQVAVRANPCCGAVGACRLGPNHGNMIGMPPPMALPGVNALFGLVKRTGRSSRGCQVVNAATMIAITCGRPGPRRLERRGSPNRPVSKPPQWPSGRLFFAQSGAEAEEAPRTLDQSAVKPTGPGSRLRSSR
jgi:hypothetical protein